MIAEGAIRWDDRGPQPLASGEDLGLRTADLNTWVRQVRGGIMAGAFAVERMLSAAIIHYFLDWRIRDIEVQEAFDEGILQTLSFERRIALATLIADKFFEVDDCKALKSGLSSLRTLRNAMAHNPFWFEPQFNDDNTLQGLVPVIRRGKGIVGLTTKFVEEQNRVIQGLIARSEALVVAVVAQMNERSPAP